MLVRFVIVAMAMAAILSATGEAEAKKRSAKDQALYEKARKDCNGPRYPGGARIHINYAGGWYRCEERESRR
jgi:hypothetical protein